MSMLGITWELKTFRLPTTQTRLGKLRVLSAFVSQTIMSCTKLDKAKDMDPELKKDCRDTLIRRLNAYEPKWDEIDITGDWPWGMLLYQYPLSGNKAVTKAIRIISQQPYCAVSVNHELQRFGLWLPSTAEIIANNGEYFSKQVFLYDYLVLTNTGGITPIQLNDAPKERSNLLKSAGNN